jgi:hypothetical protein
MSSISRWRSGLIGVAASGLFIEGSSGERSRDALSASDAAQPTPNSPEFT